MASLESIKEALFSLPSNVSIYVEPFHIKQVLEELSTHLAITTHGTKKVGYAIVVLSGEDYDRIIYRVWLEDVAPLIDSASTARANVVFWGTVKLYAWDGKNNIPFERGEFYAGDPFVQNKIHVIKAVREATGWGLKDTKDWVEAKCEAEFPHNR